MSVRHFPFCFVGVCRPRRCRAVLSVCLPRSCGRRSNRPLAGGVPAPPPAQPGRRRPLVRGPPEDSANRWSAQPPLGEEARPASRSARVRSCRAAKHDQAAFVRPPALAAGLGLDRAGDLPGVDDRRHRVGPLDSALACRSARPRPNGQPSSTGCRDWTRATTSARREAARAIVALGPGPYAARWTTFPATRARNRTFPVARRRYERWPASGRRRRRPLRRPSTRRRPRFAPWPSRSWRRWAAPPARATSCSRPSTIRTGGSVVTRSMPWATLAPSGGAGDKGLAEFLAGPDGRTDGGMRSWPWARLAPRPATPCRRWKGGRRLRTRRSLPPRRRPKQIDVEDSPAQACRDATGETRQWLKALERTMTPQPRSRPRRRWEVGVRRPVGGRRAWPSCSATPIPGGGWQRPRA